MPFVNNNQREGFSSNSLVGSDFEKIASEYFKNKGNIRLEPNFEITLGGELKKTHRFDSLRRVHTQEPAYAGEPWGGTKGMDPESNTLREQHTPTACGGVVDILIKGAVELELIYNQSRTPPVKRMVGFKEAGRQKAPLLWSHTILAALFMIVLFISIISMKDHILRSSLVDQAAGSEKIFPENPAQVVYDFLFETNSSL
ncbi:hypothetical protein LQZ21_14120 [Treponema sp. TIM-1]|uniref:hypothetical protein n=1 Tax=Treponema sp. TIM-1 TaxID=2898417 RepID=UPI00397EFE5C